MQRRGIGRQPQPASSGSTPHDRVTIPQICPSRSPALERPRQSAPRYPPPAANRPTIYRVRYHPPLISQPLHRRTTRCIGSIQIRQLARGTQITIAPAALLYVPKARFPPLEAFGRRPPNLPRRLSSGRHPKPFTISEVRSLLRHTISSVQTLKLTSVFGPNVWVIGTSEASRPCAIRMRPILGTLLRGSKVRQWPPR